MLGQRLRAVSSPGPGDGPAVAGSPSPTWSPRATASRRDPRPPSLPGGWATSGYGYPTGLSPATSWSRANWAIVLERGARRGSHRDQDQIPRPPCRAQRRSRRRVRLADPASALGTVGASECKRQGDRRCGFERGRSTTNAPPPARARDRRVGHQRSSVSSGGSVPHSPPRRLFAAKRRVAGADTSLVTRGLLSRESTTRRQPVQPRRDPVTTRLAG